MSANYIFSLPLRLDSDTDGMCAPIGRTHAGIQIKKPILKNQDELFGGCAINIPLT